jgi:PEP-CTERM motif-containing protein
MKAKRILTAPRNPIAFVALPVLAGMLCMAGTAKADQYNFSLSGTGLSGSGVLQVSNTGPFGAYTVTGISGTFQDSTNNFSGIISGLLPAPAPVTDGTDTFFSAPAFTASGQSYDNLFWPGGNSPAVCVDAPVFFGGDFDVYGLAFNVTSGANVFSVDLWSDGKLGGYQLNDALGTQPFFPPNMSGLAYAVNFTASPTPEPASLVLLGSGALGLLAAGRRKAGSWVWKRSEL